MTEVDLQAFLAQQKFGVLGTIGPGGEPQSALLGIAVTPSLEIIFDTVESSRKYPNLIARPRCSFTIGGWDSQEQTVQYEGEAYAHSAIELERYLDIYFKVWPDCLAHRSWPGIAYFVVRPLWIRYSDFDRNPPLIQEFNFSARQTL